MILENKIIVTEKYIGKSKFNFWKIIQIGDVLHITLVLSASAKSGGGMYVPDISVCNLRTGEVFTDKYNKIQNYLAKIKY